MSGPAGHRSRRARLLGALLQALALVVLDAAPAPAQTLTPELLRPGRDGFATFQPPALRSTADSGGDVVGNLADEPGLRGSDIPAPSRIFRPISYGNAAAAGAATTGFDSLNRSRRPPKFYPGQARPKPSPGPGTPPPLASPPQATANRPPLPPAMAGRVEGQPPRKVLRPDDDPFGAVGDYAGGFLVRSAVEVGGGYDSNPGRTFVPRASPFYVVAPELLAVSDWERHALVADLRGSFTGYGNSFPPPTDGTISPAPTVLDRPDFTGHVDGRLDVSRDTSLTSEVRLRLSTDNPGSPSIQAGLARYPIYTTLGGTLGVDQNFNRLELSAGATADRTVYQPSRLTDGTSTTNDDRNFDQFGGVGRVSYDLMPGVKPFAEVEGDSRLHDLRLDRNGYARDSSGGYAKGGTSFEFTRLLTGEISAGYAVRDYADPRLDRLQGLLVASSLVWSPTPLTTAKFISTTSIDETTLPGVSGVLSHLYTVEIDHDFRRWLTGIGKFTWGSLDYQGDDRHDRIYTLSGDVIYKLTRDLWLKGTLRRDWLESNIANASTNSTVVMLAVRVQN